MSGLIKLISKNHYRQVDYETVTLIDQIIKLRKEQSPINTSFIYRKKCNKKTAKLIPHPITKKFALTNDKNYENTKSANTPKTRQLYWKLFNTLSTIFPPYQVGIIRTTIMLAIVTLPSLWLGSKRMVMCTCRWNLIHCVSLWEYYFICPPVNFVWVLNCRIYVDWLFRLCIIMRWRWTVNMRGCVFLFYLSVCKLFQLNFLMVTVLFI